MGGQDFQEIEQPFGRLLSLVAREYLSMLNSRLTGLDIKRNYYTLLLLDAQHHPVSQQKLAELLNSDKVSVMRIVNYLSEKGYIRRNRDLIDRRKYNLVLTRKAQLAIPEIKQTILELNNVVFAGLTPIQIDEIKNNIQKIKRNISHNNSDL